MEEQGFIRGPKESSVNTDPALEPYMKLGIISMSLERFVAELLVRSCFVKYVI